MSIASLKSRRDSLDKEILYWENFLETAPEGSLISRKRKNGKYQYFWRKKQNSKNADKATVLYTDQYIPESEKFQAETLAKKDFAIYRLKDLKKEKSIINRMLTLKENKTDAELYLEKHKGAANLIIPSLSQKDDFSKKWANETYLRKTDYPEQLRYPTLIDGLFVRSKAEADIIGRLIFHGIPFRYEEQLLIGTQIIHPDFTCLNTRTKKIFYWEHQGGWDRNNYIAMLESRSELLASVGIIPWQNLLITTETYKQPLDINWVDCLIRFYLL